MVDPPTWTTKDLERQRKKGVALFRKRRLCEPAGAYVDVFDDCLATFQRLLDETDDFADLRSKALDALTNRKFLEALRYVAGPPVSKDDLEILADVDSLAAGRLKTDDTLVDRVITVIEKVVDPRRFPWVSERRAPTDTEKVAAVVASAALLAKSQRETARRNQEKKQQELAVKAALEGTGFDCVAVKSIRNVAEGPEAGQFCREAKLGDRKADFVVRLWDVRLLAIECKVSNSYTNSIKRLNREAVGKAMSWDGDFGRRQVVGAAVLGGVYKLLNLEQAQQDGLALFWDHDLGALTAWIESTRSE